MITDSRHKIEANRRLCILKDIKELETWVYTLECFSDELGYLTVLEKQLIKDSILSNNIKGIRRKNVLMMATLCKYEQELKTEYEYGKEEYHTKRSKYHEQKRNDFMKLQEECMVLKRQVLKSLMKFRR